jgi:hypothetical protein
MTWWPTRAKRRKSHRKAAGRGAPPNRPTHRAVPHGDALAVSPPRRPSGRVARRLSALVDASNRVHGSDINEERLAKGNNERNVTSCPMRQHAARQNVACDRGGCDILTRSGKPAPRPAAFRGPRVIQAPRFTEPGHHDADRGGRRRRILKVEPIETTRTSRDMKRAASRLTLFPLTFFVLRHSL